MAEALSLEQLKAARKVAKTQFTRTVNNIIRAHTELTVDELQESYFKLTSGATKLMDINDDIEAEMLSAVEGTEDPSLTLAQKADLEKTAQECEDRLKEAKGLLQGRLWSEFGEQDVFMALVDAEKEAKSVAAVQPESNRQAYEFRLNHLEKLIRTAKTTYEKWQRWAPKAEAKDIIERLRALEHCVPALISRTADFIEAKEEERRSGLSLPTQTVPYAAPAIKLKPTSLPKFTGNKRAFYRWWKEWNALQAQGEPSGSKEVRKFQLIESVEERIVKDLRLLSYNTADDIYRVLQNRFGNATSIAVEIVEELQKLPPIRGQQPRKIIELIQIVEKALNDLQDLGNTGALKNPLMTKSIESKLPDVLKREWLIYASDSLNCVTLDNRFDSLLLFLKDQESIYEQLDQLRDEEALQRQPKQDVRQARTKTARSNNSNRTMCGLCGDQRHSKKLYMCTKFKYMNCIDREEAVKKVGACRKCLELHDKGSMCTSAFLCKKPECEIQSSHHYYLCPRNSKAQRKVTEPVTVAESGRYTDIQEEFMSKLSPDLAKECRNAFSNTMSRVSKALNTTQSPLLKEHNITEVPVIMMVVEVTANAGQKIGALIDLASDTNYITHRAAKILNLKSENVTLVVHGVGGMRFSVDTKRYLLKIRVGTPQGTLRSHQLLCYGLDNIADIQQPVTATQLVRFFPNVHPNELKRPKEIDLLISHKEGRLVPQKVQSVGDLVLWDGPLGKTVGGAHPDLFVESLYHAHSSKAHFARSMRSAAVKYEELHGKVGDPPEHTCYATTRDFLKWWSWDSIGAACEPKCGGCRCRNCQPGGKEMTLAEEREMEVIKNGLNYVLNDKHSSTPHWHSSYPWLVDPAMLPNNRKGVEATFLQTEKKLSRQPDWKKTYSAQVHEMVSRQAAVRLTKEELLTWSGSVWYISHLVAPNSHSVSTPVRLVWNSSQRFNGLSLNDLLMKGPDVLNQIRGVLLRFRSGRFAALGDIRKMYNSVWLEDREKHLHRFLWRDSEEEEIGEYAITRVNMGDKPAGCIAQLAMRETANLPMFSHQSEERRVLQEDSYVDDILTSHNDLDTLRSITTNVEKMLNAGGFYLKPWVVSGQVKEPEHPESSEPLIRTKVLPNQMTDNENKALGLGYVLEDDTLHALVAINFSRKKQKMRLGPDLSEEQVENCTPNPLTRRELLSQVAGLYDPIGLTAPVKQKGAILVRRAFQEAKEALEVVKDTWDKALSDSLRKDAIQIFQDYVRLKKLRFPRALTPPHAHGEPLAVTFSDGSENAYGAVLYLRWNCSQGGPVVRLVEAKAKLTPLDHLGEAVKAEVCGAVFASRLKKYFEQHCHIKVRKHYHFVDSQTVLGAIQRDSYGYKTFFANRIGEIQGSTNIEDWWWIPGSCNIADILTRGASPEDLKEDSQWQNGPQFLQLPEKEWPIKSARDVATAVSESVSKLQKKAFITAVMTRSQIKNKAPTPLDINPKRTAVQRPATSSAGSLITMQRFSELNSLIRTTAMVWRAAKRFLSLKGTPKSLKWEAVESSGVITVQELEDALRDLCLAAQEGRNFPSTTTDRLVAFKDKDSGLILCGGRIHAFQEDKLAVPLLPYDSWLSTLIARQAHRSGHEGVSATLLKMRKRAWVIRGRRLAQKIVDSCILCKKRTAKLCQQVMAELPPERTTPAAPFEYTTTDLFGPYKVRDDVKKRVSIKVWGVAFCCMASRAIHAELVNAMSTEAFLLAYQRFTAIRGHPRKIWSDPGTNFIGAKTVLEDMYSYLNKLDKPAIEKAAAENGTTFHWKIHPADSPHRNGAAEAAVKILKRALQTFEAESPLSFSEFYTALQLAANLANERPIDARAQSRDGSILYVTPNSLLLGSASQSGDTRSFDFAMYPYKRLREMETQVNKFWRAWSQLAGPHLFVRSKWHTIQRNVAVGDIVWVCDQNALRGQHRLGRVVKVQPDCKGIVRDAQVKVVPSSPVPNPQSTPPSLTTNETYPTVTIQRDVRRLVVLLPVEDQSSEVA